MNYIKAFISTAMATLTGLWGWFGWLLLLWIGLLVLDYVTGSSVAAKNGKWTSQESKDGIWHKFGCVLVVVVSGAADMLFATIIEHIPGITLPFEYTLLLCPIVVVWYIITELGSIVENADAMGAPVPDFLKKALLKSKDTIEATGDKL